MSFSSNTSFSSSDLSIEFPSMELSGENKTNQDNIPNNKDMNNNNNNKNMNNDNNNINNNNNENNNNEPKMNSFNLVQEERIAVLEEALCTAQTRARLTDGQLERIKDRLSSLIEDLKVRIQKEKETATELRKTIEQVKSTTELNHNNDGDNNNNNNDDGSLDQDTKLEKLFQYDQLMQRIISWLENFENSNLNASPSSSSTSSSSSSSSSDHALTEMVALLRQVDSYQYLIAIASHSHPHQSFSACSPPSQSQHESNTVSASQYKNHSDELSSSSFSSKLSSKKHKHQPKEGNSENNTKTRPQKNHDNPISNSVPCYQPSWDMGFIEMLDWLAQSLLSGLITLLRVGTEWISSVVYGKPSSEDEPTRSDDSDGLPTPNTTNGFINWFWNIF